MLHSHAKAALAARLEPIRGPAARSVARQQARSMAESLAGALARETKLRGWMARPGTDPTLVARLARVAIDGKDGDFAAAVNLARQPNDIPEQICLTILTEVARELGRWWEEDRCSFAEVTLGMLALHATLRDLAPGMAARPAGAVQRSALMVPVPGEQHSFGIAMVAEFFRAAGWDVSQDGGATRQELCRRVAAEWFGVVALSCSVDASLGRLPALIGEIRARSLNPGVAVMLGGVAMAGPAAAPVLALADATAPDAALALREAEALVASMAARP